MYVWSIINYAHLYVSRQQLAILTLITKYLGHSRFIMVMLVIVYQSIINKILYYSL